MGGFVWLLLHVQAQSSSGEIRLEIQAGQSCCVYGTSVVFWAKDVSFGITEFTGDFLSYNGTTAWWCKDLLGTETWWALYISMSWDMQNEVWNRIESWNVKISFDDTQLVAWNCIPYANSGIDVWLNSAVTLLEKDGNIWSNYGKICELGTTNVKLKVVTNLGQSPGNYAGTLVIDLPSFASTSCDWLLWTFYDAETDGLAYIGNMWSAWTTQNGGEFSYKAWEEITFKIGNVTLGNPVIPAINWSVFVTDLFGVARTEITDSNVIEVGKLLQGLDEDNDLSNWIVLTNTASFTESGNITGLNIDTKLTALSKPIRTTDEIVQHLEDTANNKLNENINIQYSFVKVSTGQWEKMLSSIVNDAQGNSYMVWDFTLDMKIWTTSLTSNWADIFIAKLSKTWVLMDLIQSQANSIIDWVRSAWMDIDWSWNKYILWYVNWNVDFWSISYESSAAWDIFLAKISNNWDREWVNSVYQSTDWQDRWRTIVVDKNWNSYIIWTQSNSSSIFIKKFDANGDVKRSDNIPANPYYYNNLYWIELDNSGNLYIAANLGISEFTLWSTTLTKTWDLNTAFDIFIAKADANGNWLRAKQSSWYWNEAHSITVDEFGNSYIMWKYNPELEGPGIITFWTTTLTGQGWFITKLNSAGTIQRMKKLNEYWWYWIDYASWFVYAMGGFWTGITLWSITLTWWEQWNIFIGKMDTNWNRVDAYKTAWIIWFDRGVKLLSVYEGYITVGGYFTNEIQIKDKNGTLISSLQTQGSDIIAHKIAPRNKNYTLFSIPAY